MPKISWLHRATAGGLLAVVAVLLAGAAHSQLQPKPEEPAGQQQTEKQPVAVPDSATLRGDERKERREEDDLIAQQAMASWALGAMIFAGLGFVVNFIAIGLIYATFRQTKRTAEAAIEGVRVAEAAIFEDEAPFLYPEIVRENIRIRFPMLLLHDNPASPHSPVRASVEFRIRNFGQSPAILHSWAAALELFEAAPSNPAPGGERPALQAIIEVGKAAEELGDSLFATIVVSEAFGLEEVSKLVDGRANIWFYGWFYFGGTHGAMYKQTFAMAYAWQQRRFIPLRAEYNKRTRQRAEKEKAPKRSWKLWS